MLKRLLKRLTPSGRDTDPDPLATAHRLARQGDVAGAWAACQAVRVRQGESADLLALEGGLFGIKGRYEDARRLLNAALALDSRHTGAHGDLANIALAEGRFDAAVQHNEIVLEHSPTDLAALSNRGRIERARGNWPQAEHFLLRALTVDPLHVPTLETLFSVYDEAEQYAQAIALADRLLENSPESGRWLHMRGFLLYKRLFDPIAADAYFDRAERAGIASAAFWVDRGICARDLGDGTRAETALARARALEPDNPLPVFHTGLLRLYQQRYAEGWDAYEIRLEDPQWLDTPLPAPRWQGEPLDGRPLLVMAEQGLGDEIMFASCLPDLPANVPLHAECIEKLLPIFRASFPHIHWVAKGDLPAVAAQCPAPLAIPMGSLPRLYRRDSASFPRRAYLNAPAAARAEARDKLAKLDGLKVGISWRGGTEITRKRLRSLSLPEVGRLAAVPGIAWINLQYGDCAEELFFLNETCGMTIHHWPGFLDPYECTAALVSELDLVISVDTTIVHLAGALGQQVWALIPHVPEWRYGFDAVDMPWYPHVDILRQTAAGRWDEPIATALARLRTYERRR